MPRGDAGTTVAHQAVDAVPIPVECGSYDDQSDFSYPPNVVAEVADPLWGDTPREALESYLAGPEFRFGTSATGYDELTVDSEITAYAVPLEGDPTRYVTVLSLKHTVQGWAVAELHSSGC